MYFGKKLGGPNKELVRDFLIERNHQKKTGSSALNNKSENCKGNHKGTQHVYFASVLKNQSKHTVNGDAGLINKKLLNKCGSCISRVNLLFCHHINLHRLSAGLERGNRTVKMPDHANLKSAAERVAITDALCEKVDQPSVKEQVRQHAEKGKNQPFNFKLMNMYCQCRQAILRKGKVAKAADSENDREDVKEGLCADFFPLASGH